jgi:hypothetical protein
MSFEEAWQNADPAIKADMLYRWGVHEAGHAVARWALDQMNYLGYPLPALRHVAVSLDGKGVLGSGGMRADLNGVCAAGPCFFWPTEHPLPKDYFIPMRVVRRLVTADMVYTMAGPIAQQIHDNDPYEDASHWRWDQHEHAELVVGNAGPGGDSWLVEHSINLLGRRWRLHLERAFALADQIVRTHQTHIHTLAKALTERGLIDGEEVEQIFAAQGSPVP